MNTFRDKLHRRLFRQRCCLRRGYRLTRFRSSLTASAPPGADAVKFTLGVPYAVFQYSVSLLPSCRCVLVLYFLAPRQLKNTVLLLSSLVFLRMGRAALLLVFTGHCHRAGLCVRPAGRRNTAAAPQGRSSACGPLRPSVWDCWDTASTRTFSSASFNASDGPVRARCCTWRCPSASASTPSRF